MCMEKDTFDVSTDFFRFTDLNLELDDADAEKDEESLNFDEFYDDVFFGYDGFLTEDFDPEPCPDEDSEDEDEEALFRGILDMCIMVGSDDKDAEDELPDKPEDMGTDDGESEGSVDDDISEAGFRHADLDDEEEPVEA